MRKLNTFLIVVVVLALNFTGCRKDGNGEKKDTERAIPQQGVIEGKKALLVIASSNFRDEEYFDTKDVLQKGGVGVTTASSKLGKIVGMLGGETESDMLLLDVETEDYDAIVFVGGVGAKEYWNDPHVSKLIEKADEQGKVIGAICIAPVILANSGILEGKKATCFPSVRKELESKKVLYIKEPIVRDEEIVTADGPRSAREFGREILEALKK